MPWIYDPTPKHLCTLPNKREVNKRFVGAIWACGCGAQYEVSIGLVASTKFLKRISKTKPPVMGLATATQTAGGSSDN